MLASMNDAEQSLREENARLRAELAAHSAQLAKLEEAHQAKARRLEQENTYLTERLNALLARRFGASSERIDSSQLALFDENEAPGEEDVPEAAQSVKAHSRKAGGKRALPAELERVEVRHELAAEQRVCPTDGIELEAFGEEVTEQLDVITFESDFLVEFAIHRVDRVFIDKHAALRELPAPAAGAAAEHEFATRIRENNPDIGAEPLTINPIVAHCNRYKT